MSVQVEELREEALNLLDTDPDRLIIRTCWECNSLHDYLKTKLYVIECFGCGKYFYKGIDITEYDD